VGADVAELELEEEEEELDVVDEEDEVGAVPPY
jgi:hypothetical protein